MDRQTDAEREYPPAQPGASRKIRLVPAVVWTSAGIVVAAVTLYVLDKLGGSR